MIHRRKRKEGFTLLELLMVVIIIAILASIALPQYLKTTEKARMAEAISALSTIRQSQQRYKAENAVYAGDIANLDVDNPATSPGALFSYAVNCGKVNTFVATATRGSTNPPPVAACPVGYTVAINETGTFGGRDCQSTVARAGLPDCP